MRYVPSDRRIPRNAWTKPPSAKWYKLATTSRPTTGFSALPFSIVTSPGLWCYAVFEALAWGSRLPVQSNARDCCGGLCLRFVTITFGERARRKGDRRGTRGQFYMPSGPQAGVCEETVGAIPSTARAVL